MSCEFVVNENILKVQIENDNETLLSYLRRNGFSDVKQNCHEGGCGICSMVEMLNVNGR